MHAPPGFGPRPPVTGWFAEFEDLSLPPGSVGYAKDARRFLGATFDPSGALPFQCGAADARGERADDGAHLAPMSLRSSGNSSRRIGGTPLGQAELLNPLDGAPACALPRLPQLARAALVRRS